MSIKDILIHADNTNTFPARLRFAIALAQQNDAHITALYVIASFSIPTYIEFPTDTDFLSQLKQNELEAAETTRKQFESISSGSNVNIEWRVEEGDPTSILNSHGRYFDLVILGQRDPAWRDDIFSSLADDLVVSLGRPCLVVPYIGAREKIPKRILVAWNGSDSSARAINDALPLLKGADFVEVLSISHDNSSLKEGDVPAADICLHLARHGVKASARGILAKDISDADLILSHASDLGADLLVMGAYGHSRFREIILGGVTRHLLRHMTLPVFMTH